jgi:hypothetical protein
MGNDHLMYYSDSVKCDIKVEFEDWESKFTPGGWRASGLFDTLEGWYPFALSYYAPVIPNCIFPLHFLSECCGGELFSPQWIFLTSTFDNLAR